MNLKKMIKGELKPCPQCGGKKIKFQDSPPRTISIYAHYWLACERCGWKSTSCPKFGEADADYRDLVADVVHFWNAARAKTQKGL